MAADLRHVLRSLSGASEESDGLDHLAAPLLLVVHLHTIRRDEQGCASGEVTLSERQLANSLQVLQFAVEREVVSRIVGFDLSSESTEYPIAFDQIARRS